FKYPLQTLDIQDLVHAFQLFMTFSHPQILARTHKYLLIISRESFCPLARSFKSSMSKVQNQDNFCHSEQRDTLRALAALRANLFFGRDFCRAVKICRYKLFSFGPILESIDRL
ncbi:MAG: hypothetical protein C4520_01105, partial [Candidatus Abyssobacteria bacterium SURF_5]